MKGPRKSAPITSGGPGTLGRLRKDFGFKDGVSGAHAARTLMLADLSILLGAATGEAKREDFNRLIVEENILGNPEEYRDLIVRVAG